MKTAHRKLDMLAAAAVLEDLRVPPGNRLEAMHDKRGVRPETACLFAGALGTAPDFWINLQAGYDLAVSRPARSVRRLRSTG